MSQNVDETEEYELEEKLAAPTTTTTATTQGGGTRMSLLDSPSVSELPSTEVPAPPLSAPPLVITETPSAATVCERPAGARERLQSTDERALAAAATATARVNSAMSWFNFNKLNLNARKRSFNVANTSHNNNDSNYIAPMTLLDDLSRVSSAIVLNKDNSGKPKKNSITQVNLIFGGKLVLFNYLFI